MLLGANEISRGSNFWPWRNFAPYELACRHCGELFYNPVFMDKLQMLRDEIGGPLNINSAHRCGVHNARVGGAPLSQHLKLAVDIDLQGIDRLTLARIAKRVGFTGFGYYQNFLHLDNRAAPAFWYSGELGRKLWEF